MSTVTVANVTANVLEYRGQRVVTTKLLAEFYGCQEAAIHNNLAKNKEHFVSGKHFHRLTGRQVSDFSRFYLLDISEAVNTLTLWTEKGAARHAKILTTEKAWQVFEELEDMYFKVQEAKAATFLSKDHLDACILLLRSAAEDLKLAPSSVLGGYQKLEALVGVSGLVPAYAIDAPKGEVSSSPTLALSDLLKKFDVGMSAIAFNRKLLDLGVLDEMERPSSTGVKKFKVVANTEYGKNMTNPNNPRETQPHWFVSKFPELLQKVTQ